MTQKYHYLIPVKCSPMSCRFTSGEHPASLGGAIYPISSQFKGCHPLMVALSPWVPQLALPNALLYNTMYNNHGIFTCNLLLATHTEELGRKTPIPRPPFPVPITDSFRLEGSSKAY